MRTISVLVVEDFPLVREAIVAAIETDPDLHVVDAVGDGPSAIETARRLAPDVVLLDLSLPGMGGLQVLEELRRSLPAARIVVVTASEQSSLFLEAMAAGAAGFVSKRSTGQQLVQAVITVRGGGTAISATLAQALAVEYARVRRGDAPSLRSRLTDREHDAVRLAASGCTDREIGCRLYVSPRTVQNLLAGARGKLGVRSRVELARWANDHAMR